MSLKKITINFKKSDRKIFFLSFMPYFSHLSDFARKKTYHHLNLSVLPWTISNRIQNTAKNSIINIKQRKLLSIHIPHKFLSAIAEIRNENGNSTGELCGKTKHIYKKLLQNLSERIKPAPNAQTPFSNHLWKRIDI